MKKLGSDKKMKVAAGFGGQKVTSSGSTPGQGSFMNIPVESLNLNPYQPRQVFNQENLESLAQSIRHTGVLLPICIFIENDKYFIGDGERRWRASKLAGKQTVPCFVTTGNPAEVALIGNMQRADLKPIEEAEAYARMQKEFGHTHKELAQLIGKSRNNITETLSLNKLPESIKEECLRVDISKRKLIQIARKKTSEEMETAFNLLTGAGAAKKKKPQVSKVLRTVSQAKKAADKIKELETGGCSGDEKKALIDILGDLKQAIESYSEFTPEPPPVSLDQAEKEGLRLTGSCRVKLLRAGFRLFRTDENLKAVKELNNRGGWIQVDRFPTKKAMNDALKKILEDPKHIVG